MAGGGFTAKDVWQGKPDRKDQPWSEPHVHPHPPGLSGSWGMAFPLGGVRSRLARSGGPSTAGPADKFQVESVCLSLGLYSLVQRELRRKGRVKPARITYKAQRE